MGRARATVLVALVLSVGLAGCGARAGGPTSVPSLSSPTPTANEFIDSVLRTRDLGTALTTIGATITRGGRTTNLNGTGGVAFNVGYGDLTWQDDAGGSFRERSNGKGLFVQSDPPGGPWTRYDGAGSTATGRLPDVLRGLGTLDDLVIEGTEDVGAVRATRYSGRTPVTEVALGQLGFSAGDAGRLAAAAAGEQIDVTVWVDQRGRVVRVDRSVDLPGADPVSARVTTRLGDFSASLDLSPPPSASVTAASP